MNKFNIFIGKEQKALIEFFDKYPDAPRIDTKYYNIINDQRCENYLLVYETALKYIKQGRYDDYCDLCESLNSRMIKNISTDKMPINISTKIIPYLYRYTKIPMSDLCDYRANILISMYNILNSIEAVFGRAGEYDEWRDWLIQNFKKHTYLYTKTILDLIEAMAINGVSYVPPATIFRYKISSLEEITNVYADGFSLNIFNYIDKGTTAQQISAIAEILKVWGEDKLALVKDSVTGNYFDGEIMLMIMDSLHETWICDIINYAHIVTDKQKVVAAMTALKDFNPEIFDGELTSERVAKILNPKLSKLQLVMMKEISVQNLIKYFDILTNTDIMNDPGTSDDHVLRRMLTRAIEKNVPETLIQEAINSGYRNRKLILVVAALCNNYSITNELDLDNYSQGMCRIFFNWVAEEGLYISDTLISEFLDWVNNNTDIHGLVYYKECPLLKENLKTAFCGPCPANDEEYRDTKLNKLFSMFMCTKITDSIK